MAKEEKKELFENEEMTSQEITTIKQESLAIK